MWWMDEEYYPGPKDGETVTVAFSPGGMVAISPLERKTFDLMPETVVEYFGTNQVRATGSASSKVVSGIRPGDRVRLIGTSLPAMKVETYNFTWMSSSSGMIDWQLELSR